MFLILSILIIMAIQPQLLCMGEDMEPSPREFSSSLGSASPSDSGNSRRYVEEADGDEELPSLEEFRKQENFFVAQIKSACQQGHNPNKKYQGRTLLHYAALFDLPNVAEIAFYYGADPNAIDDITGSTPLQYAAQKKSFATMTVLLEHKKIDPNAGTEATGSPLLSLVADYRNDMSHKLAIICLLEKGADPRNCFAIANAYDEGTKEKIIKTLGEGRNHFFDTPRKKWDEKLEASHLEWEQFKDRFEF